MQIKSKVPVPDRLVENIFRKYSDSFEYKRGVVELRRILKKNSKLINPKSLSRLGFLYDHLVLQQKSKSSRKKLEDKALSLYRQALRLNPNFTGAVWGIGRVWWHRRSNKAIPYALRAYKLYKKEGGKGGLYAQNVGLVYESLGIYREAEKWLLKGLAENDKDFGVYLNLVVFYRLTHKFTKAKFFSKKLDQLYREEPYKFRRTPWGRRIQDVIKNADQPLQKK